MGRYTDKNSDYFQPLLSEKVRGKRWSCVATDDNAKQSVKDVCKAHQSDTDCASGKSTGCTWAGVDYFNNDIHIAAGGHIDVTNVDKAEYDLKIQNGNNPPNCYKATLERDPGG